ncbi:uncharacterized protein HKW66_Vig0217350 [Vigna angularis]|uniref:Secreted protein n=1 Tax=Phaseolus angularis TaxID=3914 RepID=A0A8T0JH50_PHAAN|nr:uncharacterized protein HKW66_Vig0217350 [Vigna angularis]
MRLFLNLVICFLHTIIATAPHGEGEKGQILLYLLLVAVWFCMKELLSTTAAAALPPLDRKSPLHLHRWTANRHCIATAGLRNAAAAHR